MSGQTGKHAKNQAHTQRHTHKHAHIQTQTHAKAQTNAILKLKHFEKSLHLSFLRPKINKKSVKKAYRISIFVTLRYQ